MEKKIISAIIASFCLTSGMTCVYADEPANLQSIVQSAITTNPEVLQSYHNYLSVVKDKDAAFGHYLPSVDLTSSLGT